MALPLGPVLEKFLASLLLRLEEEKRLVFEPEEEGVNPVELLCRLLTFRDDKTGTPPDLPVDPLPPPWMIENPDLRSLVLKMQEFHNKAEAQAEEEQCERIRQMFQRQSVES